MRKRILALLLTGCLFASSIPAYADSGTEEAKVQDISYDQGINAYPYYREMQQEYEDKGYQSYTGKKIEYDAVSCHSSQQVFETKYTVDGKEYEGILWDAQQEAIIFTVNVKEDALYKIGFEYYQPKGNGNPIRRKLLVDNGLHFQEAVNVEFARFWKDESAPLVDSQGDEVKPFSEETPKFAKTILKDSQGKHEYGFDYYLTAGTHSITLEYIDEPIFITKVFLCGEEGLESYEEVLAQYKKDGKTKRGGVIEFEAEDFERILHTTDSVIGLQTNGDPCTSPRSLHNIKMNYIGGWNYRQGNQEITWKFNVEEAGLYQLGLRVYAMWGDGAPTFRQIAIDGKVPFEEWSCFAISYNDKWYTNALASDDDEPYYVWLESGEHTLTLTVKLGVNGQVIEDLTEWTREFSALIRKIKMISGEDPDNNYDYELDKNIPGLLEDLESLKNRLLDCQKTLVETAEGDTPISNSLESIAVQMGEYIENPDLISRRLTDMETALGNVGNYITSIKEQALGIDKIWFCGSEEDIPQYNSNVFSRMYSSIVKFFTSFTKDYSSVTALEGTAKADTTLTIWVGRGKEWAEVIKQLADAYFTPETGIGVEISTIPASQVSSTGLNSVILAKSAGTAPDIVLGMSSGLPVEYAIRNAVVDLTQFEDFEEVKSRFYPQTFVPLEYEGGCYGLPETVNFRTVFYRTDILNELGIEVPDTWQELYDTTLPALYRNNLQGYIPMLYDVFLFQNGGNYYTEDLYHTALDSTVAFNSFKELCELYINYDLPVSANFFNRFRTGEAPIGVGDFSMYSQLCVSAAELEGSWAMAPLFGTVQEDGTLSRASAGQAVDSATIISSCKDQKGAWEFLKWWTSDEIQTRFSSLIESSMGVSARWNSANIEANSTLGYTSQERAVIDNFYENAQESEVVLGGYYTTRYLSNAWNNVVVNNEPVRDSFEEAIEEISKELKRRQEEFGIYVD